jgi:hypothetical protein
MKGGRSCRSFVIQSKSIFRRKKVWAILADLEAVQYYNPMVVRARYTSSAREGVDASRHCDFRPSGYGKERVVEWKPKETLTMELYESRFPVTFCENFIKEYLKYFVGLKRFVETGEKQPRSK